MSFFSYQFRNSPGSPVVYDPSTHSSKNEDINLPSMGTHYSDGVRVGSLFPSSEVQNNSPSNGLYSNCGYGAPGIRLGAYAEPQDFRPFAPSIDVIASGVVASQGVGSVPLFPNKPSYVSGTSVVNIGGRSFVRLDVPRNISIELTLPSGNLPACQIKLFMLDRWMRPMVEYIDFAGGDTPQTIVGKKSAAYFFCAVINFLGNLSDNMNYNIGTGQTFGLLCYLNSPLYLTTPLSSAGWNWSTNSSVAISSPVLASPLDTVTGTGTKYADVCGTFTPSSLTWPADVDGIPQVQFFISQYIPGVFSEFSKIPSSLDVPGGGPSSLASVIYGFPQYKESFPFS